MSTFPNVTWLAICLVGIATYLMKRLFTKKNPAPYPPGPPGWPLVGNILDMPKTKHGPAFAEWGKKYGDISHAEVLGQHFVVLNSVKTAVEMLEKKGSIYSERPTLTMAGELVGWNSALALMPYGDCFRWNRKNFHRVMGNHTAMMAYDVHLIEEIEIRRFLKRVLAKPEELVGHVRYASGAAILRISYGYEVKDDNDPFIDLVDRGMATFSRSTIPGVWIVDSLPFLAKVPGWLPGISFKRIAREWNAIVEEMISAPFQFAKDQMDAGIARKSLALSLLEGRNLSAEEEQKAKWSAANLYAGGVDTTVSSIYSLFLAMMLYPEVQKKAQAEIDAVIGPDRLPSFSDRDSLPYIEALVREVLRWNVVAPTSFAHRVIQDDIHDGYYIPKDSLVIANIWFMLNDPRTYHNPSEFKPERFLSGDGRQPETDPRTIGFGFGRRICPGVLLADASVWISTAMSLAVFDISKVVENGVEITPEIDPSSGTISHPKVFQCCIKPRSEMALKLIWQDANP